MQADDIVPNAAKLKANLPARDYLGLVGLRRQSLHQMHDGCFTTAYRPGKQYPLMQVYTFRRCHRFIPKKISQEFKDHRTINIVYHEMRTTQFFPKLHQLLHELVVIIAGLYSFCFR